MSVVYSALAAHNARVSYQDTVPSAQEAAIPEIPDHQFHPLRNPHRFFEIILDEVASKYGWIARFASQNWQAMAEKEGKIAHWIGFDGGGLNRSSNARLCDDKAGTSAILEAKEVSHISHRLFLKTDVPGVPSNSPFFDLLGKIYIFTTSLFLVLGGTLLAAGRSMANENAEEISTKEWKRIDEYAKEHNYNIVLKPNSECGGTGVVHVTTREQLKEAVREHFKKYDKICLSPFEKIEHEFRIVMLNGKPELIFKKIPPHLTGDGRSTVAELFNAFQEQNVGPEIPELVLDRQSTLRDKFTKKMRHVRRSARIAASKTPLPAHLNPNDIPVKDTPVYLDWKHNLCQGATSEFLDHTIDLEESDRPEAKEHLASFESGSSSSSGPKIVDITSAMKSSSAASNQDLNTLTRNLIKLAKKAAAAVDIVFASVDIALLSDGSLKVVEINSGVMMENMIQEHSVGGKFFEGEGFKKAKIVYEKAFCLRTGETYRIDNAAVAG